MDFSSLTFSGISAMAVALCMSLIKAIVIYIVGKIVINWVCSLVHSILEKKNLEVSLRGFLESIVRVSLWLALIIAIISVRRVVVAGRKHKVYS